MRVMLLGGTGFLGDALAARLRRAGIEVLTASRAATADVAFDATDPHSVHAVLDVDVDTVVNLAGAGLSPGTADPDLMASVNTRLPALILQTLQASGRDVAFVHAASSTERVAGQTTDESDYSRTKHAGTLALRLAAEGTSMPVAILTVHNTYGPHQPRARFVAAITDTLRRGEPVTLNYPDRVRDLVFVDDVAASFAHALLTPEPGVTEVHVGTGVGLTLHGAALEIAAAVGADPALVSAAPVVGLDPNPVTVSPELGGTYGLCTTSFTEGIRRTVKES